MPISPDTQNEIQVILQRGVNLPPRYASFLLKWSAYNRTYNETETIAGDKNKAVALAGNLNHHWNDIADLAQDLGSIECIGGRRVQSSDLLQPKPEVKAATHFLREQLGLDTQIDPTNCRFNGCARVEKRILCNQVIIDPWNKNNMAALMRLVYQVRCSLVHGEKRLGRMNYQTNRDRELIRLADEIMTHFLNWINNDLT